MNEYERYFVEESNRLAGIEAEVKDEDVIAWSYLKEQKHLTEFSVMQAWALQHGENLSLTSTRKNQYKDGIRWELIDTFLTGWTFYAEDNATSPLKALMFHRQFMICRPFSRGNGRIGRLLFLWMVHRNEISPKYYFSADSEEKYGRLMSDGTSITYNDVKSFFKKYE